MDKENQGSEKATGLGHPVQKQSSPEFFYLAIDSPNK